MLLSFIIPAHNEAALLEGTLAALHTAARRALPEQPDSYEIIVVADGCTDRTPDIAAAAGARVVSVNHRKISATRNSGAREARGDWLFFVDADTYVPPETLAEAIDALRAGAVAGGAGIRFDAAPLYVRLLEGALTGLFHAARITGSCFLFCTRATFDAAGPWDESVYAKEGTFLCTAIKQRFGSRSFVVTRARVVTSGRKLMLHSGWELLSAGIRLALKGRRGVANREGLDFWYNRREPQPPASNRSVK